MGIFSRFKDIVNSNINSMLDKAENPEKLIRLMIQEMEDTLVELKASCAGAMASRKRVGRELEEAEKRGKAWAERAELAINKGREDLAREALIEKKRLNEREQSLDVEAAQADGIVEQYQAEIMQLEEKLNSTREKQRMLIQRHQYASKKRQAAEEIRKVDSTDAWMRFEQFENRVERMEAEADLVRMKMDPNLEEEFSRLEDDDEIEEELEALKASLKPESKQTTDDSAG